MRGISGRSRWLVIGMGLLASPIAVAAAQGNLGTPSVGGGPQGANGSANGPTTIEACYVPASGTIYRISTVASPASGAPTACVSSTHVQFSWNWAGVAGAQGTTGPQGVAGPKGDPGAAGAVGAAGAAGATGPQGDPGPKGADGVAGPAGATGPAGPRGFTGLTGPVGPVGAQGPQGPQGPAGPKAFSGFQVVSLKSVVTPQIGASKSVLLQPACPAGKDVIGGGAQGNWTLSNSYPYFGFPRLWIAEWDIPSNWAGITPARQFTYTAYAICAVTQ